MSEAPRSPGNRASPLALPARVVYEVVPALLEQCGQAFAQGAVDTIDLAACRDFDSSLIGLLLDMRRRASATGQPLRLSNPPENLRKLALLYGVNELLFTDD